MCVCVEVVYNDNNGYRLKVAHVQMYVDIVSMATLCQHSLHLYVVLKQSNLKCM